MTTRLNVLEAQPEAYQAMLGLERYLATSPLPKRTLELVKLRASQINGCAFCVDMHSHDLRADDETDERLFSVVTWREAPWFTPAERAALALTEQATRLDPQGVTDEVWTEATEHYDPPTLAALVTAIATINAWNRFGVALRLEPGSQRKGAATASV
ncbi:carboxymuconolactone decarboxylase family protein [Pseudonocardia asaccharolytica]|uniref:Alkyl hydroperoxide reductase AhpD n=1 Tax=Pseudonocardia asaccharolytica DSM 44247 = NBRC 16224 TaxID=1123024 RepID=A0A511D0K8_9PSEU|nr:carboxymuconolactone decarboxylase family protein [Pseudonocardia asaccharolytica]GEL18330.1 alkyl hydroperoxide reductase AhpD [Pseudonocardia asaccharolytica DSM 44247 = NBRC 16224]